MEKKQMREILHSLDLARRKLLKPRFLELGLTVGEGQPRILKTLLEKGPMTQRELSDFCMLDVTTMSRTLDKLEEAGLLQRTANPERRRSYLVCLTEQGEEKAQSVREIFQDLDRQIWREIPKEEMEQAYRTLEKIGKNLKERSERENKK